MTHAVGGFLLTVARQWMTNNNIDGCRALNCTWTTWLHAAFPCLVVVKQPLKHTTIIDLI